MSNLIMPESRGQRTRDGAPATTKVLLISDIPENAAQLQEDLEREGCDITISGSLAGSILELNSGEGYQLILLDFQFASQNPQDIIEKIKKNQAFCLIPLIGLVHRSMIIDQLLAFELGIDDFILIPYSTLEIQLKMRSLQRLIHLQDLMLEKDRQLDNLKNVQRITVTLNHYINNALTPLYFAVQLMEQEAEKDVERLKQIANQTVDFVSKVLKSLNKIVQSGKVRVQQEGVYRDIMYDIEKELNELLEQNR